MVTGAMMIEFSDYRAFAAMAEAEAHAGDYDDGSGAARAFVEFEVIKRILTPAEMMPLIYCDPNGDAAETGAAS